MFTCVWHSGRVGGTGHYDNSSETPARKELGVCNVDKFEFVCLGHGSVFESPPGSWLRLSIIRLACCNSIMYVFQHLLSAYYGPDTMLGAREES